ncbi:MAG TPA: hypothetical protein VFR58_04815 [Flavisolibacter sp.]|nr:hypothetical protein [Flavisolibacter sp.]
MKNTIFVLAAAMFASASVNAQSTVDSIRSKYQMQAMPEALTLEKTFPVIGSYQLNNAGAEASSQAVTVTLDQENKGIVWVEGLPEGKFKAYLKKAPGTYRIVAQKSESGKQIPEGTLIFDPSTSTLNVALGKKFDDADPAAIFNLAGTEQADLASAGATEVKVKSKTATSKSKTKVQLYSAVKAEQTTSAANSAVPQQ